MVSRKTKRRIFDIIQIGNKSDTVSRAFDFGIVLTIILNILAMLLETFDSLADYFPMFQAVEWVTVVIFCGEYALRIWTAQYLFPGERKMRAVWKFITSFDGIIDLLTILPFLYLTGFVVFRMLRVVRIFHLFRINATYDSFNVITTVLYEKRTQLLSSMFLILILMLASSLFMYSAEHEAQPELFSNAFSGIWWSMSTLLTVGYGDIYPVTAIGRAMAIVIAFLGVGAVAIPTGIISAGFVEQFTKMAHGSDDLGNGIHTLVIDLDSSWLGKSVGEIEEETGLVIAVIKREDETIRPTDDCQIELRDKLAVYRDDDVK